MLTYLRIAVTALSLTACVLFVALLVRSYWYRVNIQTLPFANRTLQCSLTPNGLYFRTSRRGFRWLSGFWQESKADNRNDWDYSNQSAFYVSINQYGPGDVAFRFPYWFPVVITTAFAAAPWVRWRFSIRTVLIATTLVAVVLGAIVAG